jgi:hypothetical protein
MDSATVIQDLNYGQLKQLEENNCQLKQLKEQNWSKQESSWYQPSDLMYYTIMYKSCI